MKKQNMFSGIAFVILLAAGSLFAQMNNNPIKANVPFDFTAGSATLPAGEYRVAAMSEAHISSLWQPLFPVSNLGRRRKSWT
jgi:hypothetical protein